VLGQATRAANASYTDKPPFAAISDDFIRPERYTPLSGLFTFALVLQSTMFDELRYERMEHPDQVQHHQPDLSLSDLPPLWRESAFTVYFDDAAHLDTRGMSCTEKWLGQVTGSEVGIVVVRPDGYVGTVYRSRGTREHALKACKHLDQYFAGFLNI
jgi:phenol 2-monooxygenase